MLIKCPCCNAVLDVRDGRAVQLTPVELAILTAASERFDKFWRGTAYPVRLLAEDISYSTSWTRNGLEKLRLKGYIQHIPYGKSKRRHRYVGILFMRTVIEHVRLKTAA